MTVFLSFIVTLLLGAPMALVSAVPNVTVTPIGRGCSAYPNWYPSPESDTTGGFRFRADQADNSSINGLYSSVRYFPGSNGLRSGNIVITPNTMGATPGFCCVNGVIEDLYLTTAPAVTTIYFSASLYDAQLTYLEDGGKVETYAHEIGGVRQDGVFIGAGNVTTWGFKYQPASASEPDYIEMRLLGPNSSDPTTGKPLRDGEFKGFLKVEGL
ncbi:hypothetical protein AOQ84DRAFT_354564 [Glonium stellatum]|uniref:Uncharacterized protein n=1 Tax=Glonium stellatum TaxID=574774 RepID=A0A8E2JT01_9PEZI|nr:hypothetical protein AOQ84DRAFT_354564 [Glonium stellatum]